MNNNRNDYKNCNQVINRKDKVKQKLAKEKYENLRKLTTKRDFLRRQNNKDREIKPNLRKEEVISKNNITDSKNYNQASKYERKKPNFKKHKSDELRKMAIHTDFFINAPLQEQAEIWKSTKHENTFSHTI